MTVLQGSGLYVVCLIVFLLLDMVWLGLAAKTFYRKQLGYIMAPRVNWTAAAVFYVLFIAGLLFFAVLPAHRSGSVLTAGLYGLFFGLCSYATYDLTNLATIRDWPLIVTIVDIVWGTVLGGVVAAAGYTYIVWVVPF